MVANWRRGTAVALLAAVVLAGAVSRTGAQQGEGGEKIWYEKAPVFLIPFSSGQQDAYRIQSVLLYVSEDYGKTYQYVGKALPTEKQFRFTARSDGPYWFVVQTQDVKGQLNPPTNQLSQAEVGLKVIVDTKKPQVELKQVQSRDGAPAEVDWNVFDENLDLPSLRLDYRPAGGRDWTPLPVIQMAQGKHSWNPNINGRVEVRLQVRDKAGNESEAVIPIVPAGVNPMSGGGVPGAGSVAERPQGNLFYVNSLSFNLDYELENVGKSNVKHVEIWRTIDRGRTWVKYKDAPPQSPFRIDVAGDGRYGFIVVAVSGAGLAGPRPRGGEEPEIWVEVDTTPPVVRLLSVDPGQGADQGRLTIRWTATDKNLALQPILISWAEKPEGPWNAIVETRLPNDGKYIWVVPETHPYQFYVRVEAIDVAKNVGSEMTSKPVAVDTKIPRAKIKGVTTDPGARPGVSATPDSPPRLGVSTAPPEPAAPAPGGPPTIPPPGGQF
jgi:hypothetical protein